MSAVREWVAGFDAELILYDGFDRAILGVAERASGGLFVCYDRAGVLKALQGQGMDEDEALEWYEFNVLGGYVGEHTPCFLDRYSPPRRAARSRARRRSSGTGGS